MNHIKIFLSILFCILFFSKTSAQERGTTIVRSEAVTGTKEYIASDYIKFSSGFSYKAGAGESLTAQIDKLLVLPPSDATYLAEDGTTSNDKTQGSVVGTIPGSFNVSGSGAATYTIPIECPAGIGSMKPNIAISYNSQGGIGIAGYKVSLSGLSSITRMPHNPYYDGDYHAISFDGKDRFALDGQPLILTNGTYGAANSTYGTEVEDYSTITAKGTFGKGPAYFVIETKDGTIMEYGRANNAAMKLADNAGVFTWYLNKVTDKNGNYMEYFYDRKDNDGETWISEIKYTGNTTASVKPMYSVVFEYEEADQDYYYCHGNELRLSKRLKNITIKYNNNLIKKYELSYSLINSKYYLTTISLENSQKEKFKSTVLDWQDMYGSTEILPGFNSTGYYFSGSFLGNGKKQIGKGDDQGIEIFDFDVNTNTWKKVIETTKILVTGSQYFNSLEVLDVNSDGIDEIFYKKWKKVSITEVGEILYDYNYYLLDIKADNLKHKHNYASIYNNKNYLISGRFRGDKNKQIITFDKGNVNSIWDFSLDQNISFSDKIDLWADDVKNVLSGDFNGDGIDEVLIHKKTELRFYRLVGKALTYISSINIAIDKLEIGDVNSDGTDDFFDKKKGKVYYCSNFNKKHEILVSTHMERMPFKRFSNFNKYSGEPWFYNRKNVSEISTSFLLDVNNDTKLDIVKIGQYKYEFNIKSEDFSNRGYTEQEFHDYVQGVINDFNVTEKIATSSEYTKDKICGYSANGDPFYCSWGSYKVIMTTCDAKQIALNREDGTFRYSDYGSLLSRDQLSDKSELVTGDFRGDGLSDIFIIESDGKIQQIRRQFSKPRDFVGAIYNGLVDNSFQITHKPLISGSYYTKEADSANDPDDVINMAGSSMVVTKVVMPDGKKVEYEYGGAKLHTNGKGFLGFKSQTSKIYETEASTGYFAKTEKTYLLDMDKYIFLPFETKNYVSSTLRETTKQTFKVAQAAMAGTNNKRITIRPNTQTYKNSQTSASISTTFSNYDAFGNARTITTNNSGISRVVKTIKYPTTGWWRKVKPDLVTTTTTRGSDTHTQEVGYGYYSSGKLNWETVNSDLKTNYDSYDAVGNPTQVTVTAKTRNKANQVVRTDTRTTKYAYKDYRFLASETDVQAKQTVSYEYDAKWGALKKQITDLGTTTYMVDDFGRTFETIDYNGIHSSTSLQWKKSNATETPAEALYCSHTVTSGQADQIIWYDKFGREVRKDYSINGKNTFVKTQYNTKGQVWKVSEPYFSGTPTYNIYTYNTDGSVKTFTAFNGDITSYTYKQASGGGLITTVTGPRGTSSSTTNKLGEVVQSADFAESTVKFDYYASGLQKEALATGNDAVTVTYDKYGNRLSLIDPNAGTVTSLITPLGQVLNETDNKGNTTVYAYDTAGRLQNMTRGNEVIEQVFDKYGRITSATKKVGGSLIHQQTMDYDEKSPRLIRKTETIDNKTFSLNFAYDSKYHRLQSKTYHDGFKVKYVYNGAGELNELKAEVPTGTGVKSMDVWKLTSVNAKGQVTAYSQGGKLNTTLGYDVNGLPMNNLAKYGSTSVFHLEYGFSDKYNLEYRIDHIQRQKEQFEYDDKNHQLTSWSLYDKNTDNTYTFKNGGGYNQYQPSGNIDKKKDPAFLGGNGLVEFKYGELNAGPHAISSYYGNPTDKLNHTIDYTVFNKVSHMHHTLANNKEGSSFDITYGIDDLRRKTTFKDASKNTLLTRYYFDDYEEEVLSNNKTRTIHYISGGNGLAAMYVKDNASNVDELFYAHTDYQGSLTALTNTSGTVVKRFAYDPWGNRRNPDNWAEALTDDGTYQYTARGYTMHEHLDGFGLINMNGRVYDPMLSRFLSPDPILQAPELALNYNRYTYCLNNPMLYSDPTGNTWGIFKPFVKAWNWFWEKGDQSAQWLSENNISVNAGVGYNSSMGMYTEGGGNRQYTSSINSNVEGNITNAINDARGEMAFAQNHNSLYEVMSAPSHTNIFDGRWGKVNHFLSGGVVDGWKYDWNGDLVGIAPISGYAPAVGTNVGSGLSPISRGISLFTSVDLTKKMILQIERIKSKVRRPEGMVYQLTPIKTGEFWDKNKNKKVILHPGDVYKYGKTINGISRYSSERNLAKDNLRMIELHNGISEQKALIYELYYIYGYYFMHGQRPPGNPIFK